MRVLVSIVTYNRFEMLKKSLEALKTQEFNNFDIFVFNNKSTDETEKFLSNYKKNNKRIIVKNSEINTGGAGGFYECVKYAIENQYDYAWLMDDDAIMNKNTLKEMMNAVNVLNNEFSFLSCTVKWKDNNLCKMNYPTLCKWDMIYENKNFLEANIFPIENATFVGCFINVKHVKKFGLPIKEFFIYYDDIEYTLRISKEKSAYWVLNSEVVHMMNSNENMNVFFLEDIGRIKRLAYDYRNRFYCEKRESKSKAFKFFIKNYLLIILLIALKKGKHKFLKIRYMTKGILQGLRFNPQIVYLEK